MIPVPIVVGLSVQYVRIPRILTVGSGSGELDKPRTSVTET